MPHTAIKLRASIDNRYPALHCSYWLGDIVNYFFYLGCITELV